MRFVLPLLLAAIGTAADLPWYIEETAMTADGRLTFLDKPWWPRARALEEGQSIVLDHGITVRRENGHIVEEIPDGPGANKAYVVSFKGTGLVDRLLAYIDNDNDGKADEMELRHYRDGYLRYAWFGENYDGDGIRIFDLKDWSYAGNNANNKFRGNVEIYLNKYDPKTRTWVPLSECPFAFWDYDRDGHGDIALRVSAAPMASLTGADRDYANNYNYMWSAETTPLEQMGNVNVRFSFNIDPGPRRDPLNQPHYTFGFTMTGAAAYRYPHMAYTNPRRRPPQTVTRVDWRDGVAMAMKYPARETGFTWDESHSVRRWEGQFWIFERVYLSNTGGPTERWNMRREFSPKASSSRDLYYSEADRRYHLAGTAEGWMEAGHVVNDRRDLEFRWFDTDGDGRLDTIQVFRDGIAAPVRISHFDPRARAVALDRVRLIEEYNGRVLPEAIAGDERLLAALKKSGTDSLNDRLAGAWEAEAAKTPIAERRRYCLDIARELRFLKVRDDLWTRAAAAGPYPEAPPKQYTMADSLRYWDLARGIERFIEDYANGRFDEAAQALERIETK
jgi:hypothetical protein